MNEQNFEQPFVFISYSSADKRKVNAYVKSMRQQGVNLWIDEQLINTASQEWYNTVFTVMQNPQCKAVLFFMSESSMTSPACLIELEFTRHHDVVMMHEEKELPILIVSIDNVLKKQYNNSLKNWVVQYLRNHHSKRKIPEDSYEFIKKYANYIKDDTNLYYISYSIYEKIFEKSNSKIRLNSKEELLSNLHNNYKECFNNCSSGICNQQINEYMQNNVSASNQSTHKINNNMGAVKHTKVAKNNNFKLKWSTYKGALPKVIDNTFTVKFLGKTVTPCKNWKEVWRVTLNILYNDGNYQQKFNQLRNYAMKASSHPLKTFFLGQKSRNKEMTAPYEIENAGYKVENYWNKENMCKEIKKLFKELEIPNEQLEVLGEVEDSSN